MANRFYFISSLFFLAGSGWAAAVVPNGINLLLLIGSIFFFLAAGLGVLDRKK